MADNPNKNNIWLEKLTFAKKQLSDFFARAYHKIKIISAPFLEKISNTYNKIKNYLAPYFAPIFSYANQKKVAFSNTSAGKFIEKHKPRKTMRFVIISLLIFFGLIFLYKMLMGYFIMQYIKKSSQVPVSVSVMEVQYQPWTPELKSSGSLRAIKGVNVTTEIAGLVRSIRFKPGSEVQENALLVELNSDTEKAQLASLIASFDLAKITLERDQMLYKQAAVSKATLDASTAQYQSAEAQVEQQKSIIAKKNITAPFTGKLGISLINPGQYLNPGDEIVTLQALDPIYIDFYIPQQYVHDVTLNETISFTTNTFPDKTFHGNVTTVNPLVDTKTRNVEVEATLHNPDHLLYPGMFGNVTIDIGKERKQLTVPQTAVTYNPYGNIVFLVLDNKENKSKNKDQATYTVKQVFVETGERRGNQIAIISGLKAGDKIVTSGQMKLKNGSQIIINNAVQPNFDAQPQTKEEE